MPHIKHLIRCEYKPTFRTEKVAGMFDIPVSEKIEKSWDLKVNIEEKDWQIGLIVGNSGAGKTTIAKELFKNEYIHEIFEWEANSFLDDFDENLNVLDIVNALNSVGFSSPPSWILPFSALSNGQKFKAEIARCLLEINKIIVFDEFTSVVDRNAAKIGSYAVSKHIKKQNKKFVAVTCHYDVEEWLQPDWVLDISQKIFKWGSLRRPKIELDIFRVDYKAWELFKDYHYLSANINRSAIVFVAEINKIPVAMTSALPFVHPTKRNFYREHRTVVLPDYQGVGIGNKLSEFLGNWLKSNSKKFISITGHPSMIHYRSKSEKWHMTRKPSHVTSAKQSFDSLNNSKSSNRLTASFEYRG
ncbi:MAG: ABC transporter ATP-binding protein [Gammaproteobacteria bacterium CG_4_10_14_0_8_um_filter_38_16]|nr:MAG: ABC transporter ATP-binding protein [Gammaproteobacteria bacterium CG_4_10_14_0_8_um_filter_38_16]